MKRILSFVTVIALLFTACEGDPGPPGPPGFNGFDGQDGLDGLPADDFAARSFEVTVDFEYFDDTGLQEALIPLPVEILERDAVLVYRLEGTVDVNGQPADTWSPLPQNFFLEGSDIIQYIFNHTFVDVEFLIDGNFDLSTLGSEFTDDQVFRVIVLPVEPLGGIDTSNLSEVMSVFDITEFTQL